MTLVANCLTSHDEMKQCFSSYGVTAFSDHNRSGIQDDDVVDFFANRAHSEFLDYAGQRYNVTALATQYTARGWVTVMACYMLTTARGNAPPEGLALEFARIMEKLPMIQNGTYILSTIPLKYDTRPTMSNLGVDRRYPYSTIRVKPNSSDPATQLTQDKITLGVPPYE